MSIQIWIDSLCIKEVELYHQIKIKYLQHCVLALRNQADLLEREERSLSNLLLKLRRLSNIKRLRADNERKQNNNEPLPGYIVSQAYNDSAGP